MKLKIGDKVQCVKDFDGGGWKGMIGTVVAISYGSPGVNFKKKSPTGNGHTLNGRIETATGWWFEEAGCCLKKVNKQLEFQF